MPVHHPASLSSPPSLCVLDGPKRENFPAGPEAIFRSGRAATLTCELNTFVDPPRTHFSSSVIFDDLCTVLVGRSRSRGNRGTQPLRSSGGVVVFLPVGIANAIERATSYTQATIGLQNSSTPIQRESLLLRVL
ncbi:hypothetical protein CEXT_8081 [Caerostris extrusa]|uniref:Uncharacterized protein n=1 Tax=Caerostris extrusa TaxID=172846 RepID=A0AAV4PT00_CAEEX|nr:hypothetical protein CEXT_8081 [Caerostris extrusa]